jgi:hypothetical protein
MSKDGFPFLAEEDGTYLLQAVTEREKLADQTSKLVRMYPLKLKAYEVKSFTDSGPERCAD